MIEEYHQQISATDVLDEKKLFTQDEIEEFDQ
jgi:predicted RNA-binding protein